MDAAYPWSILGIAPTDDAKAIRKAYALKLRETRPDENPAGFQALVEARDAALAGYFDLAAYEDDTETAQQDAETGFADGESEHEAESDIVPEVDGAEPDDALTQNPALARLSQSLQELGPTQSSEELRARWRRVFESFDDVSFDDHWLATHQILHRLVNDMQESVPEIPAAGDMTRAEFTNFRNGPFGAYVDVLRDLDAHFQLSQQDTMVFDFLAQEDGFYLIEALSIALRPASAGGGEDVAPSAVPFIPGSYVEAGFSADAVMIEYYQASVRQQRFASGFSLPVAVLALPFTLYFKLYRLFALLAGTAAMIGIFSVSADEDAFRYWVLAIAVYVVASLAIASQWRRLRVSALNVRINRLVAKGLTRDRIVERLRALSQLDVLVMNASGVIAILCWVGLRYGHNLCRFQEYCR